MPIKPIITILGLALLSFTIQTDFLTEQKKFVRVRTALNEKQGTLEKILQAHQIPADSLNLLLVAYKDQDQMDVYAKTKAGKTYKKITSYAICSRSGELGPKRKQGDGQVPEGFYHINRFNPTSNFYLSLGLNYPNLADKRKSKASDLGGDIFIHGSCVTIGCLPMTDNYMKEIYLLAVYARNNGQNRIPVYVFPFQMTEENMTAYLAKNEGNAGLISFWTNLKTGYDLFIQNPKELNIKISASGDYVFQ